jgi:hypothetical protein
LSKLSATQYPSSQLPGLHPSGLSQKTQWTADSRFFVFSTASSGGHSPWHWQTYFYDRGKNVFKELDDFTGPVIKRDFILTPPDKVEVTVQGASADPSDIVRGHAVQKVLSTL